MKAELRRELERIEIPGEHDAREGAWAVLETAFAEREPVERRPRHLRVAAALAVVLAVVGAAFSPPGQAVLDEIREVVGVENAAPALFRLPVPGMLLVHSDEGVWVVQQDGSRRLLGSYREASWSPFGRYLVAARQHELAALEPDGSVRWTLPRPRVRLPRWTGSESDTRIAYLASGGLHIVAGDGTGDVDLTRVRATVQLAPAWRPGRGFILAFVNWRGRVRVLDVPTGNSFWQPRRAVSARFPDARKLVWSDDGRRLLLVTRSKLLVFGTRNASPLASRWIPGVDDAAFEPGSHRIAVLRGSEVLLLDADRLPEPPRRLLTLGRRLESLAWSPDGRWLLVGWPAADQWVFVRADGKRIRAVSNVSEQFRSAAFPRLEGWCCGR